MCGLDRELYLIAEMLALPANIDTLKLKLKAPLLAILPFDGEITDIWFYVTTRARARSGRGHVNVRFAGFIFYRFA